MTAAYKLPVSLQVVLRALIEEGLKREDHPGLLTNIERQAQAVRQRRRRPPSRSSTDSRSTAGGSPSTSPARRRAAERGTDRHRGQDRGRLEPDRAGPQSVEEAHAEGRHLPGNEATGILREALGEAEAQAGAGAQAQTQGDEARGQRGRLGSMMLSMVF